jgi:hypothetical protein
MVSYLQNNILYVFYMDGAETYDDVIAEAHRKHGTESGTVNVICKPKHKMDMVERLYADHFMEKAK